jgi:transcriptional regulator with XRE-family HTH domain
MEKLDKETQDFLKEVGKKVYEKRKEKQLTQEQIAELLGMTPAGYAKIERGLSNFSISRLMEIAKKLEIELDEILQAKETSIFINSNNFKNNQSVVYNEMQPTEIELLKSAFTDLQKAMTMVIQKLEVLDAKQKSQ